MRLHSHRYVTPICELYKLKACKAITSTICMQSIQITFAQSCDRKYEHYVFALSARDFRSLDLTIIASLSLNIFA